MVQEKKKTAAQFKAVAVDTTKVDLEPTLKMRFTYGLSIDVQ